MKIPQTLHKIGIRSDLLHSFGLASIGAAVSLWGRSAAESDKHARARAERLAIFIGLWPPTFFVLGKILQDIEQAPAEQAAQAQRLESATVVEAVKAS